MAVLAALGCINLMVLPAGLFLYPIPLAQLEHLFALQMRKQPPSEKLFDRIMFFDYEKPFFVPSIHRP